MVCYPVVVVYPCHCRENICVGLHHVAFRTDKCIADCSLHELYDMLIIVGGRLDGVHEDTNFQEFLWHHYNAGKFIAVCCTSLLPIGSLGLFKNHRIVSTDLIVGKIEAKEFVNQHVLHDGNVVTARGFSSCMTFSLELCEILAGKQIREEIEENLL
ncbi:hypothetical protein RCL1_009138 [Eukaryota sp. TZLM3-RCL]